MKIFKSTLLQEIETATCEAQNIDSLELLERTANAVCYEIMSRFLPGQRFVIIAGPGNNGGVALAVARLLFERGYRNLEIFLFNTGPRLSHDCDEERKKLITIDGIDFTEVSREFTPPYLSENDVVIDALFGAGLTGPLAGGFAMLTRYCNESGAFIISLDIPSGLHGEENINILKRDVVHANLTLVFQLPRLSFFLSDNADLIGEWKLLDLEYDQTKIKDLHSDYMLVEAKSVRPLLRPRRPFTGKRDYGSAIIFAGSVGMMGAAVMCAQATMRSGAGLATVHSAWSGMKILQTAAPEVMFEPDRNEHFITDMTIHHAHQAVAVGPGIGTRDKTIDALEALLKNCKIPMLLDADALNCIAKRPALLTMLPQNTILTPHIGEFDRLFGEHRSAEERLQKAIEMARHYNVIIVLKGHFTAIVRPTGRVYFNSTGNPGMATGGSGDVLTGVIAACLAQGYRPEQAATMGVYIHGLAGDLAAQELGEVGMTASDISNYVGRAIRLIITRGELPNPL
ncbi:MAG: NAD(P)H-hydrate dehydratase [Muribaculaceae bacterium]|nr:NAD(P)H-hydrate dehydratase [Muribaculaceae bacterium]MDE7082029.1 NAD(P)H-hydrate dehydratase [Muribaculaceae bacterium]